jgi:hypothetical protein
MIADGPAIFSKQQKYRGYSAVNGEGYNAEPYVQSTWDLY